MISFSSDMKIWVYTGVIDMRKSINGLTMVIVDVLKQDPQGQALYLFTNKQRDKLKGLFWHDNGFILLYKRMERDKFIFPQDIHSDCIEIDSGLLQWLLKGFDFYKLMSHQDLKFTEYY